MSNLANHINELKTAEAFSRQAEIFDECYNTDEIIQYKRQRVRDHVSRYAPPNCFLLELNCGTGEDAIFFARQGHRVHATDISDGMLAELDHKMENFPLAAHISYELCSFTELQTLNEQGPFDYIFSNFGGLNCTNELNKVLHSFGSLLKPGGVTTLVIISKFCLWETLLVFKGRFKTAFRRFFSSKGRKAHVEGVVFKCWYYNPSYVIKHLKNDFNLLRVEGLCTIVPPSYIEGFGKKFPRLFSLLKSKENKWAASWPWKYLGDYYIISLQKK